MEAMEPTARMTTESHAATAADAPAVRHGARRRADTGPDRLTVVLFSVAAFLIMLALLIGQLTAVQAHRPTVVVMRREYRTTVITTIKGGNGPNSVSASVSSSGASTLPAAPTTRVS
jgi:hypothetical protein